MNDKIIMLFLDLEGTIIEEESGVVKHEEIRRLLTSLERLQKVSESKVNIHIVSPVSIANMERIINELDKVIIKFNLENGTNIKEIEGAVAYPDKNYIHQNDLYDKIFPMKLTNAEDMGRHGKLHYVNNWMETMRDKVELAIYGGNGINDVGAMNYIRHLKNGIVICPNNSHESVKKISNHISQYNETEGIKEGIDFICNQIEARKETEKNKNKTEQFEKEK